MIKAPPPGSLIADKYVVERMLGSGGMGIVLAATHQKLEQKVAIKLLQRSAACSSRQGSTSPSRIHFGGTPGQSKKDVPNLRAGKPIGMVSLPESGGG